MFYVLKNSISQLEMLQLFWQLTPGTCTYPANFNATKTVENKLDQQQKQKRK